MGGWFLDPTNLIRAESFQIRLSLSSGKKERTDGDLKPNKC